MSDTLAEITTLEGQAVPIKSADEWFGNHLGDPEDSSAFFPEGREKVASTAEFMGDAAKYFSKSVGDGGTLREDLEKRYGDYEQVLRDRARDQTGEQFVAELGGNCGKFAEALSRRVDQTPTAELVALLRVLKGGSGNFDRIIEQSGQVREMFAKAGEDSGEPQIVGGELITPTAIRAGETSSTPARERGWLTAITRVYGREGVAGDERQVNVQAIIDGAVAAGVSKEVIKGHLLSLGVTVVNKENIVGKSEESRGDEPRGVPLSESQIGAYLTEMTLQIPKVRQGWLGQPEFQAFIDEAKRAGVPKERIKAILEQNQVPVTELVQPEEKIDIDYQVVGTNTANELRISQEVAENAVNDFLKRGEFSGLPKGQVKSGQEAIVGFFEYNGVEYVVKESLDTDLGDQLQPVYGGDSYKRYAEKMRTAQEILDQSGVTQYAPITEVQAGERTFLIQRRINGPFTISNDAIESYRKAGVGLTDPKGNIMLHRSGDGVTRPVLIDFGWLGRRTV